MSATATACLLLALLTAYLPIARGEQDAKAQAIGPLPSKKVSDLKFKHQSFTFVRIQYSSRPRRSPSPGASRSWMTDYPDADLNFTARFEKEIGLKCERDGRVMTLTNS